jgi:hypothetical protein
VDLRENPYGPLYGIGLFILVVIGFMLHDKIRGYFAIRSNNKHIQEIITTLNRDSSYFINVGSTLLSKKTKSLDFEIYDHPKKPIQYKSLKTSNDSSVNYTPDFSLDTAELVYLFRTFDIEYIRVTKTPTCPEKVKFIFPERHFYSVDRRISITFFPNAICDSIFTDDKNPSGYNWTYKINSRWTIKSSGP